LYIERFSSKDIYGNSREFEQSLLFTEEPNEKNPKYRNCFAKMLESLDEDLDLDMIQKLRITLFGSFLIDHTNVTRLNIIFNEMTYYECYVSGIFPMAEYFDWFTGEQYKFRKMMLRDTPENIINYMSKNLDVVLDNYCFELAAIYNPTLFAYLEKIYVPTVYSIIRKRYAQNDNETKALRLYIKATQDEMFMKSECKLINSI